MAIEIVDFPIKHGWIFHCYVSSPEGNQFLTIRCSPWPIRQILRTSRRAQKAGRARGVELLHDPGGVRGLEFGQEVRAAGHLLWQWWRHTVDEGKGMIFFNEISWGFDGNQWDSMGIWWKSIGIHGDFMGISWGFDGNQWEFMGISFSFHGDWMEINGNSWGFHEDLTVFPGIYWDFVGMLLGFMGNSWGSSENCGNSMIFNGICCKWLPCNHWE